jgi:hypothetical protein
LKYFKKRFKKDKLVEAQFKFWFRHGYSVELTHEEFLTLAGLTYFAPAKSNDKVDIHIMSAVKIATEAKRRRSVDDLVDGLGDDDKNFVDEFMNYKRTTIDGDLDDASVKKPRTLNEEIQAIAHESERGGVEIVDTPVFDGELSLEEQRERLTVKADNGTIMPALMTWLTGTYVGHAYATMGYSSLKSTLFSFTGSQLFDAKKAADFFAAPWNYHPAASSQLLEVFNTAVPINRKIESAISNIPKGHMLEGITTNELYRAISQGSSAVMDNGQTVLERFGGPIKPAQFADAFLGEDHSIINALQGNGEFNPRRLSGKRLTNAVNAYLHFDPSKKLEALSAMLMDCITHEYLSEVYSDYAPEFIKDVVEKMKKNAGLTFTQAARARQAIGDQSAAIMREKIQLTIASSIISFIGTGYQIASLAKSAKEVKDEFIKYRLNKKDSKLTKAMLKMIIDSDHAYNIACWSMATSVELMGTSAALSSGVALSSFAGPLGVAGSTTYLGTALIRSAVNSSVRRYVGLSDTIELKMINVVDKLTGSIASRTINKAVGGIAITKAGIKKLADGVSKIVNRKRSRREAALDDLDEISANLKKARQALKDKDISTAVKTCENMMHNKHFSHRVLTSYDIHI